MAKKIKKLLAVVLAMVMCLGCFTVPAYATESGASKNFPINKTANGLDDNDQTDVTLTVPGTVEGNIDVVFILGGGMTANMETIESAINVFKPVMENGKATVRLGILSLEKGKELVLDLNTDEAVLDPATYVNFVEEKLLSINDLPEGNTNLHSQLLEAQDMLAKETKAKAENKYVFVLATGRTYWFDDANGEAATIVNKVTGTDKNTYYYWGNYLWQSQRGNHTSLYMIPEKYKAEGEETVTYADFFKHIEEWVAKDGDKYVYTPHFDVNDYSAYYIWKQNNNKDLKTLKLSNQRYGTAIVNPKPTNENFITGTAAGASSSNNLSNALNYERAQYECVQVWKELVANGYNCYSICSETPNYQNNSEYIDYQKKVTANYFTYDKVGNSTIQVGHAFMDYLAELAGHRKAPVVWKYLRDENGEIVFYPGKEGNYNYAYTTLIENFFDSVRDDMLYTTSIDSTVEDFIGKNENGNFEFIENAEFIKLNVGGVDYITEMTEDTKEGSKYAFKASEKSEPTFWLDYYYGDGETTERFVWTFGENVSLERVASLTYKLQLTEKLEEAGKYTVPTNNSATLYPVDSDKNPGTPQLFPVPSVEYEVVPYDVDIVLALGAGIAQYDADNAKGYTHTYDSIVSLVEPLVNQGINVKLGLVAVEHYDDVALPLTVLTKNNYLEVITEGLNTIQAMPAGPTNLHGNIVAAKEMLDADTSVPAENKFFYVIATGRTYNYDNADGVPTTIINKVALKGSTYYYWGHYLWQSQRGGHTSLYMIPAKYNNDFEAFWADVCKWVEADGDKYAYSFTEAYDPTNPEWYVGAGGFYTNNTTDAKALKLASSRFGWILNGLTNSGLDAIGSGSNPQNALNYERAQYEAYQAYQAMKGAGYTCEAICSESANYQNGSEYIKQGAKYTGTSTIQLGHSFMNFLNDGEAKVLFDYTRDEAGNLISTAAVFKTTDYFTKIDVSKLAKSTKGEETIVKIPMMSAGPKKPALQILTQPVDAEAAVGETVSVYVEAQGEGLKYQWFFKNAGSDTFSKSSIKTNVYETEMNATRAGREVYCVITDANGNTVTSDTVTLIRVAKEELKILTQPVDATAAAGETISVAVEAQGEGLKYVWYFCNAGGSSFSKSSITSSVYETEMNSSRAGRQVYCVITDALGNKVTSDTVTLIRVAKEELEIVNQPVDAEAAFGETVSVKVDAKGEGLKYRWYFRNAGTSSFSASSITSATYETQMNASRAGREIYCVITDALGNQVTTETVTLIRVAKEELKILTQPVDAEAANGESIAVSVEAQGESLTYRWYFRNAGASSFSKSSISGPVYETQMNNTRANREVYCVITDALGNQIITDTVTLIRTEAK